MRSALLVLALLLAAAPAALLPTAAADHSCVETGTTPGATACVDDETYPTCLVYAQVRPGSITCVAPP